MTNRKFCALIILTFIVATAAPIAAGTLRGYLRDMNWYSRRYTSDPFGVGMYEYGINANGQNISQLGGATFSDIFGYFSMSNLPAGTYTVGSWSCWWRPAFAFNVNVPASGDSSLVDLRLRAAMWGYACFWDATGYYEFGQTFKATGPISMIFFRAPYATTYYVTVHQGGPGGVQVGVEKVKSGGGDHRIPYSSGEMPTIAGQIYYLRIRTASPAAGGVLCQMDPRPDYSDPMPEGCLYLGTGSAPIAYPDRDLGVTIMCDDDGLITNIYNLSTGANLENCTSAGQTFRARGTSLISAAIHSPTSGFVGVFRVLAGGPGGAQVGTTKRASVGQWATPQLTALWAPGECPLTPGSTYYLEVTRDGGGLFIAYASGEAYADGQAYRNGTAQPGVDLTCTLVEEVSSGAATKTPIIFSTYPEVTETNRGTNSLTITWTTTVPADSLVEWAEWNPPYTNSILTTAPKTNHSVTITGLNPNTMYHYRVTCSASGYRTAISRDLVICTKPIDGTNLLTNPGMEEGTGSSPRWPIPGWTNYGSIDIKASDGSWFWGIPKRSGNWFIQGAINGVNPDGGIYQQVSGVTIGRTYNFTAWVTTWARENDTWKYDVWDKLGGSRLDYIRLGIDPYGGTNPDASSVIWTPRMYSHLRYTNLGISAVARATTITVFVSMKGDNLQWHLFGVDDCALSSGVCEPPVITTQPISLSRCVGQSATFSVVASGTPTLSYQWRWNETPITWAKSSSMTISSVQTGHAGDFDCVVTNSCGSATSSKARLTVLTAPVITVHPVSQTKTAGESVTFFVGASGSSPLSYSWTKNGMTITGATLSSYTISSVAPTDVGSYACTVTNSCGSSASDPATLTVIGALRIPQAKQLADGTTVSLGGKPVTFAFADYFYVEEVERSGGIRVVKSNHGLIAGVKADIVGIIKTNSDGERYIEASSVVQSGSAFVQSVFLVNREVGGSDWYYDSGTGAGQKGVKGASSLNNIGLLMATTGRVTYAGTDYFYVDDGSALSDGSGRVGVKVLTMGLALPNVGDMVKVIGISSCFKSGADLQRLILARQITKI